MEASSIIRGYRDRKPGEMAVFAKCRDLISYTLQVTNNTQRFTKKMRFTITNRVQDKTLLVYEYLIEANEIYPSDSYEYRERKSLQRKALALCKQLQLLAEICFEKGSITENSLSHVAGKILEIQKMTTSWMVSDNKRFSDL